MIQTLTPIVVATAVSFCFKETRWLGIISLAVLSYFYPLGFTAAALLAGISFGIYKMRGKNG